jgi:hypothetical protein
MRIVGTDERAEDAEVEVWFVVQMVRRSDS